MQNQRSDTPKKFTWHLPKHNVVVSDSEVFFPKCNNIELDVVSDSAVFFAKCNNIELDVVSDSEVFFPKCNNI